MCTLSTWHAMNSKQTLSHWTIPLQKYNSKQMLVLIIQALSAISFWSFPMIFTLVCAKLLKVYDTITKLGMCVCVCVYLHEC